MAAPRNRGLWANGKPIAPGSRIPVSREALAGQQVGEDMKAVGDAISSRVREIFSAHANAQGNMTNPNPVAPSKRPTLQVKKDY